MGHQLTTVLLELVLLQELIEFLYYPGQQISQFDALFSEFGEQSHYGCDSLPESRILLEILEKHKLVNIEDHIGPIIATIVHEACRQHEQHRLGQSLDSLHRARTLLLNLVNILHIGYPFQLHL